MSLKTPALLAALALVACTSGTTDDNSPTGGPVTGPSDTHCTVDGQPVVQATTDEACHHHEEETTDGGTDADAGVHDHDHDLDGGTEAEEEEGATLFNAEGDDADCKYHVKFTTTPVRQGTDVTFDLTATKKTDASGLVGAEPYAEVYLDDTHAAPNSSPATTEVSAGRYTIGPVRFDKAGRWTVRFHFYSECADGAESPHGHAAFYLDVP